MTTAPTGPSGPAGPGPGRDLTGPTQPTPAPLPNPGPPPAPGGRLPTLAQIVGDATKVLTAAIVMLGRQWDPTTGPSDQCDPWGPEAVDISLGSAVADVRSALRELAAVAALSPARQSTNSASLPGGPPNHLAAASASGGRTSGLVDAASHPTAGGIDGSGTAAPGRDAGESSDPRPAAWDGHRREAGVGFTLPAAKRFTMPGRSR